MGQGYDGNIFQIPFFHSALKFAMLEKTSGLKG